MESSIAEFLMRQPAYEQLPTCHLPNTTGARPAATHPAPVASRTPTWWWWRRAVVLLLLAAAVAPLAWRWRCCWRC